MRTILLYNPQAGTHRNRRRAQVELCAAHLRASGFVPTLTPTTARGSAAQQAREAIAQGTEAVFACGGDGTVHDVLQGIAGTGANLGILPLGSANALARELRISRDPIAAARQYRPTHTTNVPLGIVARPGQPDRYFLSMAGAGPDGALMYRMLTASRSRWGHWLYYAHALRLFLRRSFPRFTVRYRRTPGAPWQQRTCISIMALRIGKLGGFFSGIARGAALHHPHMRLLLVHPPATLSLPLWFLSSWVGLARFNPWLTIAEAQQAEIMPCTPAPHLQADGEWLGSAPATLCLSARYVNLFTPAT